MQTPQQSIEPAQHRSHRSHRSDDKAVHPEPFFLVVTRNRRRTHKHVSAVRIDLMEATGGSLPFNGIEVYWYDGHGANLSRVADEDLERIRAGRRF